MRILTGDECGLLKETIPEHCRPIQQDDAVNPNKALSSTLDGVRRVDPNEPQRRARGVVDMCFTSTDDSSSFAALRANGTIQLWESTRSNVPKESFGSYQCTGVVSNVFEKQVLSNTGEESNAANDNNIQGRPIALDSFLQEQRLCAVDSLGTIAIVSTKNSPTVVATYSPFINQQQQQQQTLSYTKGSYANTSICTAMAVDPFYNSGRVAVSGRERETRLLDMSTGQVVWKAKNVPPDPQTLLQQPIWSTALAFFNESTMAVGTAFSQVRLYDVRTNSTTRRPIAYTPDGVLSHRITALCPVKEHQLVVGDAAGSLHLIDVRLLGKGRKHKNSKVARLVGPAGCVRQVVKHASLPIICTVGLDRMLRTFDLQKRKQVDCVYMKQRLNCVLFCQDDTWNVNAQDEKEHVVEEYHGRNDVDAEDEVQDYIDSSGDEHDENVDDENDSDEQSDEDSDDDSQEDKSQESDENESDASDSEDATRGRDFKRRKRV